jgi:hypothetical protein
MLNPDFKEILSCLNDEVSKVIYPTTKKGRPVHQTALSTTFEM